MPELRTLTALRGLAAMAIVVTHFSYTAQFHAGVPIPSLVPHGYMAVDFFFVLSGFIMCFVYLARFEARVPGAYRDFLARRVARLMPLNTAVTLAVTLIGLLYLTLVGRNPFFDLDRLWFDLPANLLLLPGFGIGVTMNGPSWSVSVEIVAYLAFPILAALVFHRLAAVRLATLTLAILGLVLLSVLPQSNEEIQVGPDLVRCLTEFVLGMFTFHLYRTGRLKFLAGDESVMLLLGAIALTLLLGIDLPASLLFPLLILACARNTDIAARLLGARLPHFLGVISYALYMTHNTLRDIYLNLARIAHPEPFELFPALAWALFASVAVIPVAWLAYRAVERPGRRLIRRALA